MNKNNVSSQSSSSVDSSISHLSVTLSLSTSPNSTISITPITPVSTKAISSEILSSASASPAILTTLSKSAPLLSNNEILTQTRDNALLFTCGSILEKLTQYNDTIKKQKNLEEDAVTAYYMFKSKSIPNLSINSYINRLSLYCCFSDEVLIAAMRNIFCIFEKMYSIFPITSLTVYRIMLVNIMVTAKFYDDVFDSNLFYSKAGGITLSELNNLEIEFLNLIGFELYISPKEFAKAKSIIETASIDAKNIQILIEDQALVPKGVQTPIIDRTLVPKGVQTPIIDRTLVSKTHIS